MQSTLRPVFGLILSLLYEPLGKRKTVILKLFKEIKLIFKDNKIGLFRKYKKIKLKEK